MITEQKDGSKQLTVAQLHITTAPGKTLTIAARADAPGVTGGSSPSRSHAFFDLPTSLSPGVYPVSVSNSETATKTPLCTFLDSATSCLSVSTSDRCPPNTDP